MGKRQLIYLLGVILAFLLGIASQQAPSIEPIAVIAQEQVYRVSSRTLTTQPAIARGRAAMRQFVFGSPALPRLQPVGGVVTMQNGFTSTIREYGSGQRVVLWHFGHGSETPSERAAIDALVADGWRVMALHMPLTGANATPVTVEIAPRRALTFALIPDGGHNMMPLLEDVTDGSPLRYFVDPVIAVVNQLEAEGVRDIRMGGLSGGGWTVVLAMALDTRIDAGVSVAGSLPLSMRSVSDWGDWEQWESARLYDYVDLYAMAAQGRRLTLVYNTHDDCCFAIREAAWADGIEGVNVVIDHEARGHVVGAVALEAITR